ncbi:hypothetical protein HG530_001113 [Fusarium avenaceum]|nr:hypothetical protein HG530_001113 [Fusarium avenaceum]
MQQASRTFSAILGDNFKEGRMLQEAVLSSNSFEIHLSGDDFEAMKLVCIAIHTSGQTKLDIPKLDKLVQIYKVTNTYGLFDAVSIPFGQEKWRERVKGVALSGLALVMSIINV